ncbi:MAG TPA: heavy-metal-associated domain-containing protein [Gaiellaceae bacterium]|jgi:copper chaperone
MSERAEFVVPDMSCGHCRQAISEALSALPAVTDVQVDLDTKHVVVEGEGLDDSALRAAIVAAGYEAEP